MAAARHNISAEPKQTWPPRETLVVKRIVPPVTTSVALRFYNFDII